MTPGAYLKARRCAAGLSIADIAQRVSSEPYLPDHDRAYWLEKIEADVQPAAFPTIAVLRCVYAFDLAVLEQLSLRHVGADIDLPRLCWICGCSPADPCEGFLGCWAVANDRVCNRCGDLLDAADAAENAA